MESMAVELSVTRPIVCLHGLGYGLTICGQELWLGCIEGNG